MEGSILLALQSIRVDGLTQFLALISALGSGSIIWVLVALLMFLFEEQRGNGIILLVALIITSIVTSMIASFVGRACPADTVAGLVGVVGVSKSGYAMPSLHAATAFATTYIIARGAGKGAGAGAFFLALVICFARMYLGVAYPSDIIVGTVLGIVIAAVLFALFGKVFQVIDRPPKRPPRRKRVTRAHGSHSR